MITLYPGTSISRGPNLPKKEVRLKVIDLDEIPESVSFM